LDLDAVSAQHEVRRSLQITGGMAFSNRELVHVAITVHTAYPPVVRGRTWLALAESTVPAAVSCNNDAAHSCRIGRSRGSVTVG